MTKRNWDPIYWYEGDDNSRQNIKDAELQTDDCPPSRNTVHKISVIKTGKKHAK